MRVALIALVWVLVAVPVAVVVAKVLAGPDPQHLPPTAGERPGPGPGPDAAPRTRHLVVVAPRAVPRFEEWL